MIILICTSFQKTRNLFGKVVEAGRRDVYNAQVIKLINCMSPKGPRKERFIAWHWLGLAEAEDCKLASEM